jgi:hypothetical protein
MQNSHPVNGNKLSSLGEIDSRRIVSHGTLKEARQETAIG